MSSKPVTSIVICTYNGAKCIGQCLSQLTKQSSTADGFETIIVIDGSTDATAAIVQQYAAQVIQFSRNRGRAASRNAGLAAADGDIVIFLDDDCVVEPGWLSELTKPFADDRVIGVGGKIIALTTDTLAERYLESIGYGNPAPTAYSVSSRPLARFVGYLSAMYGVPPHEQSAVCEVREIYTANSAYRAAQLSAIGGFDQNLSVSEDSDICTRLRGAFPNMKLVFAPAAVASHCHNRTVRSFLVQTFQRAPQTLAYYRKHQRTPPIFPFPIIIGALVVAGLWTRPRRGLAAAALLPPLSYGWWPLRAVRRRSPELMAYPFVQFMVETATDLGLLWGALQNFRQNA